MSQWIEMWVTVKVPVDLDIDTLWHLGADVDAIRDALEDHMSEQVGGVWSWSGGPNTSTVWAQRIADRNRRLGRSDGAA